MFRKHRDEAVSSEDVSSDELDQLRASLCDIDDRLGEIKSDVNERANQLSQTIEALTQQGRAEVQASDAQPDALGPPFKTKLISPNPVTAPAGGSLSRLPPRRADAQQEGYLDAFDSETIFYDVFRRGDDVFLSGPPTLNMKPALAAASFRLDGADASPSVRLVDRGRTQRSIIADSPVSQNLSIEIPEHGLKESVAVGVDYSSLFAGRKVLMTLSKNNELSWIHDWLTYYHKVHGVDSVLFYDNASDAYQPEDLQATLGSVHGIKASAVVSWPFKYGPGGGPKQVWDSDYCQYSVLEHAHWRFLRSAAGVINADIDELVVTDDGRSAYEHAEESEFGVALYAGRWIEMVTDTPLDPERTRRFTDYRYHVGGTCTTKWTLIPGRLPESAQWRVHSINDIHIPRAQGISHRHFKGINTNWKYNRKETTVETRHQVDEELVVALGKAFSAT